MRRLPPRLMMALGLLIFVGAMVLQHMGPQGPRGEALFSFLVGAGLAMELLAVLALNDRRRA